MREGRWRDGEGTRESRTGASRSIPRSRLLGWKRTLERAVVESTISSAQSTTTTKLFYLIPGLAE
jgi:hypothetical protein